MKQTYRVTANVFLRLPEPTSFPQPELNRVYTGKINWQTLTAIEEVIRRSYR